MSVSTVFTERLRAYIDDLRDGPHGQSERRYVGELLDDVFASAEAEAEDPGMACLVSLMQLIEEANGIHHDLRRLKTRG